MRMTDQVTGAVKQHDAMTQYSHLQIIQEEVLVSHSKQHLLYCPP